LFRTRINKPAALDKVLNDLPIGICRLAVDEREGEGEIFIRVCVEGDVVLRSASNVGIVDGVEDVGIDAGEGRGEVVGIGDVDAESEVDFELLICSGFEGAAICGFLDASELDIGRSHPHDKGQNNANNK